MGETTGRDGRMSITDELRKWLKSLYTPNSGTVKDEGERIADRIDAEHERVLRETGEEIVADVRREWMPLPVDAEGAPVRIGDVMEWVDGDTFEVVGIGDGVLYYVEDGGALANWALAESKIHHAPTVEDVLEEFVARWMETHHDDIPALKAEFAKRLTLADGEDA